MPADVNAPRSYDSPRRRQQAAATRRAILDAAYELFDKQGYATTTMAQVASGAEVSLKTVYLAFETKAGLLRALWHLRLRGDEDTVPVEQRAWYTEVLAEPDPERRLKLNARNARAVKERAGPLLAVIRNAAAVDPDIGALWARIGNDFYENQRAIVTSLHGSGALRPGLGERMAADILWALNHPDVWQLLVGERGWTPELWEVWFAESACEQLLGQVPAGGSAAALKRQGSPEPPLGSASTEIAADDAASASLRPPRAEGSSKA